MSLALCSLLFPDSIRRASIGRVWQEIELFELERGPHIEMKAEISRQASLLSAQLVELETETAALKQAEAALAEARRNVNKDRRALERREQRCAAEAAALTEAAQRWVAVHRVLVCGMVCVRCVKGEQRERDSG